MFLFQVCSIINSICFLFNFQVPTGSFLTAVVYVAVGNAEATLWRLEAAAVPCWLTGGWVKDLAENVVAEMNSI